MKLSFSRKNEGTTHFLLMEGDLIGEEVGPRIVEFVTDALREGAITYVLDLEKVRYISSSGLGLLITLLTKMKNAGGELVLVSPSEHVRKLLAITKLSGIFTILDSMEDFHQKKG
ncbi:MAG: hypothetical protein RL407_886 [Bacteroidota bacterium]